MNFCRISFKNCTNEDVEITQEQNIPHRITAVILILVYSANNASSTTEILAIEMKYLHRVFLKNNYPDWMIKESEKKLATPIVNPDNGVEVKKNIFIPVPCVPGLSEEFERIF